MPEHPPDLVLPYGRHPDQLLDVRLPPGAPRAVVVLVHGGFWRQEWDRHHTDRMAADLAGRGFAVATLEYRRLGGAGGWPDTFGDVAAAIDVAPELLTAAVPVLRGLRVVLVGHSAGGQLALWAAGRHRLPASDPWSLTAPPALAGVVALAPVADLEAADELSLDDGVVSELFGASVAQRTSRMASVDPAGLPPDCRVVVVHGDRDVHVPLSLSQRYVSAVRRRGADATLDVVARVEHFAVIEPDSAAWPRVLAALDQVLAPR